MRKLAKAAALLVAWVALAGLDCGEPGTSCTLIGCSDQLTVELRRAPPLPYQVTLTLDGKPASFTCDANGVRDAAGVMVQQCAAGSFVLVGAPASVTVKIPCGVGPDDAGAVSCEGTATPTYKTTQPNGPNCDPTCRQATVTVF